MRETQFEIYDKNVALIICLVGKTKKKLKNNLKK